MVKHSWKPLAGAAILVSLLILARLFHLGDLLRPTLERLARLGPRGYVLFIALYVGTTVLLLPASLLTLGAGAFFGLVRGFFLVWIAASLGACAAFLVSRYLARSWVQARFEGDERFRAIDEAVGREGWKIVGLARLTPLLPFTLLNYAFGMSRVSFRDYALASSAGMIPGTAFYVYLGSVAGQAAGLAGTRPTGVQWLPLILGLVALVAVVALITRIARRALERKL